MSEWGIEKILSALFKLLHKSPARRSDYFNLSASNVFPFCATRWVANGAIERAIEVWDDFVKLIRSYLLKPPSIHPKDNKYHTNPLVPFLSNELGWIMCRMMRLFSSKKCPQRNQDTISPSSRC